MAAAAFFLRKKPFYTMPRVFSRAFSKKKQTPLPPLPIKVLNPIETFDLDEMDRGIFETKTHNILNQFPIFKVGEPFRQVKLCNRNSEDSYFNIKLIKKPFEILPLFGWNNFRVLGIEAADGKIHVVDKERFCYVPETIIRNKCLVYPNCVVGSANVGFNYGMLAKAVMRLGEGIKDGNGEEYAKDISRIANFTSRSAISVEMMETTKCVFRGDRKEYVYPNPTLVSLLANWDRVSSFIREGGEGELLIDGFSYSMDDFRKLIRLINADERASNGDSV